MKNIKKKSYKTINKLEILLNSDTYIEVLRTLKKDKKLESLIKLPDGFLDWEMDQNTPYHSLTVWEHTLTALENFKSIAKHIHISNKNRYLCNLAILFHDTGKLNPLVHGTKVDYRGTRTTYYNHEKYSQIAAEHALSEYLSKSDITIVQRLIQGSGRVNPNYVPCSESCNLSTKALSKFVKYMDEHWLNAIYINMADASSKNKNPIDDFDFYYHLSMKSRINVLGSKKILRTKPLLNGKQIASILNKEPGLWIQHVIDKMLEWQYSNPKASEKDAAGFVKMFKV